MCVRYLFAYRHSYDAAPGELHFAGEMGTRAGGQDHVLTGQGAQTTHADPAAASRLTARHGGAYPASGQGASLQWRVSLQKRGSS